MPAFDVDQFFSKPVEGIFELADANRFGMELRRSDRQQMTPPENAGCMPTGVSAHYGCKGAFEVERGAEARNRRLTPCKIKRAALNRAR